LDLQAQFKQSANIKNYFRANNLHVLEPNTAISIIYMKTAGYIFMKFKFFLILKKLKCASAYKQKMSFLPPYYVCETIFLLQ